jgi:ABC-type multidrug transport system permease subunit
MMSLAIARSELKRVLREPAFLFVVLMFPIAMTLAFGTAFNSPPLPASPASLAVVDLDGGVYAQQMTAAISSSGYAVIIPSSSLNDSLDQLRSGGLDAVLVIPSGFTAEVAALRANGTAAPLSLPLYVAELSPAALSMPEAVDAALWSTVDPQSTTGSPLALNENRVASTQTRPFDVMVPGLFAFSAVFITMTVAQSLTSDREKGILARLGLTRMSSRQFMLGLVIVNSLLALIQAVLVLSLASALGYQVTALIGAIAVVVLTMVFAMCSVGLGMITAAIAKSSGSATGIAFIFILPQMFLGTFVGSGPSSQSISALMPAHYLTAAAAGLLQGNVTSSVLADTVILCIASLGIVLVGAYAFSRRVRVR